MNTQVRDVLWGACRGIGTNDFVFPNPLTAEPYTDIKHSFDTACANAGIEGLWWHDLRASLGTRLGAAGVGMKTIMDLMGHRDPKTSLSYVRSADPAKWDAVQYAFQQLGHKTDTRRLRAVTNARKLFSLIRSFGSSIDRTHFNTFAVPICGTLGEKTIV